MVLFRHFHNNLLQNFIFFNCLLHDSWRINSLDDLILNGNYLLCILSGNLFICNNGYLVCLAINNSNNNNILFWFFWGFHDDCCLYSGLKCFGHCWNNLNVFSYFILSKKCTNNTLYWLWLLDYSNIIGWLNLESWYLVDCQLGFGDLMLDWDRRTWWFVVNKANLSFNIFTHNKSLLSSCCLGNNLITIDKSAFWFPYLNNRLGSNIWNIFVNIDHLYHTLDMRSSILLFRKRKFRSWSRKY